MCSIVLKYVTLFILVGLCSSAPAESGESLNYEFFTCNNNHKVPMEALCNGTVECSDGSDEKASNCMDESRDSEFFYCSYGVRIKKDDVCNGVYDCLDGSDEYPDYCVYHKATEDEKSVMNTEMSGNCSFDQFQCKSGKCIEETQRCDGHVDCEDGLDETPEICLRAVCPDTLYTCAYGACVSYDQICDGVNDCADGSDEILKKEGCNLKELLPGPTMRSLIVPKFKDYCHVPPQNKLNITGWPTLDIKVINNISHVAFNSGVKFKCEHGYNSLEDLSTMHFGCGNNNSWSKPLPKCMRQCTKIRSDISVSLSCTYKERGSHCGQPLAGTTVSVNCAHGYRQSKNHKNILQCKDDGEWSDNADPDLTNDVCVQTCGIIEKPQVPYAIYGYVAKTYQLPWHIALYNVEDELQAKYLCSGSIISANWVLTAAHCVMNVNNEVNVPGMFLVIANKQYKDAAQANTDIKSNIQMRNITFVYPHEKYNGDGNSHQYDIALLNVAEPFIFDTRISPICGPTEEMLKIAERKTALESEKAYIGSYSSTSNGEISRLLGYVNDTHAQHTRAKFYIDRPSLLERGDSGGGICIENTDNKTIHIRGVLSTGELQASSVVSISDMYSRELVNWIREKVSMF